MRLRVPSRARMSAPRHSWAVPFPPRDAPERMRARCPVSPRGCAGPRPAPTISTKEAVMALSLPLLLVTTWRTALIALAALTGGHRTAEAA